MGQPVGRGRGGEPEEQQYERLASRDGARGQIWEGGRRKVMAIKVILTGATGMVGEGVLLECLENPAVEKVLAVGRRKYGMSHPKLTECVVPDFLDLSGVADQLNGYDACFY